MRRNSPGPLRTLVDKHFAETPHEGWLTYGRRTFPDEFSYIDAVLREAEELFPGVPIGIAAISNNVTPNECEIAIGIRVLEVDRKAADRKIKGGLKLHDGLNVFRLSKDQFAVGSGYHCTVTPNSSAEMRKVFCEYVTRVVHDTLVLHHGFRPNFLLGEIV